MPKKYFTLDQANKTLPLVRKIVSDITTLHPKWRDLVNRYELVAAQSDPKWGESPEQVSLHTEIEHVARQISEYMLELEEIGCVFKGFEEGLVDFYGQLEGRDMFWCWKQGEERISHWHELEAGFAGRQQIPELTSSN